MTHNEHGLPHPEWELDAYRKGDVAARVAARITGDRRAAEALAALQREDALFAATLYRITCPAPAQLLNFQWDMLEADARAVVAAHVADCPHCMAEALELAPEAAANIETDVGTFIDKMLARLKIYVGRPQQGTPRVAPVRQARDDAVEPETPAADMPVGDNTQTFTFAVSDLDCDVILTRWRNPDGTLSLQGQLLGEPELLAVPVHVRAIADSRVLQSTTLDEAGTFRLEAIPAAPFKLCFQSDAVTVCLTEWPE